MFWISFKYFQENTLLCEIAFPWFFFLIIFLAASFVILYKYVYFFYFTLPSVSVKINLALLKIISGKRFVNGCCWIKSFMSFYWIKTSFKEKDSELIPPRCSVRHRPTCIWPTYEKSWKHFRTIELYIFFPWSFFISPY